MAKRKWIITGSAVMGMASTIAMSPADALFPSTDMSLGMGFGPGSSNPYVPLAAPVATAGNESNSASSTPAATTPSKAKPAAAKPKKTSKPNGTATKARPNKTNSPKPAGSATTPKPSQSSGAPKPTATSAAPQPSTGVTDGTFQASTDIKEGFRTYGTLVLKVTVSGGKIVSIDYSSTQINDSESYKINSSRLPKLVSEALAAQNANIATVSGATYTSKAFRSALASALSKAGF